MEGDERHRTTKGEAEDQGHEETAHTATTLASEPVTQGELIGNQQFNGIEEDGVVDGTNNVGGDHFEVHADEGHRGDDLQGKNLPLAPQILQMKGAWLGSPVKVDVRLKTDFACHLSTPSPASMPETNPCPASSQSPVRPTQQAWSNGSVARV